MPLAAFVAWASLALTENTLVAFPVIVVDVIQTGRVVVIERRSAAGLAMVVAVR